MKDDDVSVLVQIDKIQGRIASLESRSITREDFLQNKQVAEIVPNDRLQLHYFIEIPKGWKPAREYYRKYPKIEKLVLRASDDSKPTEYEDPKFKTAKTASYADPYDCNDPNLAADLKRRSAERVVPLEFEKDTNRPIVGTCL